MPIRVAVVDDHPSVREGLKQILSHWPGFECCCACATAEEAAQKLPPLGPDVVLMDINLPGRSGIECVRALKAAAPQFQIIMLTIESDRQRVFECLEAGATGYLVKTVPPAKLVAAIEEVHAGGAPMSSPIARMLVRSFHRPSPLPPSEASLSDREKEVLDLLASGLRSREIGERLGLSPHTVNAHVRRIYEKLQVRSRAAAVSKYQQEGGGGL